jgi:hypothetical protein
MIYTEGDYSPSWYIKLLDASIFIDKPFGFIFHPIHLDTGG